MAGRQKKYEKREFKKLLEMAMKIAAEEQAEGEGYSLAVIKSTAQEMGISGDKIERAAILLEEERRHRRRVVKTSSIVGGCVLLVAFLVIWSSMPKAFTGSVSMKFTTGVSDDFLPYDDVTIVNPYYQKKVFCYVTFYGLKHFHDVAWEFYSPQQNLENRVNLKLDSIAEGYNAYGSCNLSISSPPGQWKSVILADGRKIAEKTFSVEFGGLTVTLSPDLDENDNPLNPGSVFSVSRDAKIYCHLSWEKISGKHNVEWKWIDPSENVVLTDSYEINPTALAWWVYNTMKTAGREPGQWRVVLSLDTVQIADRRFTLND